MSQYHIGRIGSVLDQTFSSLVDMSDWERRPQYESQVAFRSRALAALCIKYLAGVDDENAANSVVDGFDDGGIDALLFEPNSDTFIFVSSKWDQDGSAPMNEAACGKFADGVRDILAGKLERFNKRIKEKDSEIRAALTATRTVRILLVTAHVSEQQIGLHGRRKIDDLVADLNMPSLPDQAEAIHLDQDQMYGMITSLTKPKKIDIPITLSCWGVIERPFLSYYGRANVVEVSSWWQSYQNKLCDRNIRHFFQRTDVNDAMRDTLARNPEYFWYFNNGITIICDSVKKSLAGSPGRDIGLFNCCGVSVVNGAQTVGMIGSVVPSAGAGSDALQLTLEQDTWVQVRVISLERCPPGFENEITTATNFQNAVAHRDFAAMDPIQHRLAADLALDRRRYVYKSGEEDPRGDEGCSITEATQALGCATSIDIAVRVKRGISEMWRQTSGPPYTDVFNRSLTSVHMWRAVLVARAVDDELQGHRGDLAAVHLNRVMLNMVFQDPIVRQFRNDKISEERLITASRASIREVFPRVVAYVTEHHPRDYLGNFCKNTEKCRILVDALLRQPLETRLHSNSEPPRAIPIPPTVETQHAGDAKAEAVDARQGLLW